MIANNLDHNCEIFRPLDFKAALTYTMSRDFSSIYSETNRSEKL